MKECEEHNYGKWNLSPYGTMYYGQEIRSCTECGASQVRAVTPVEVLSGLKFLKEIEWGGSKSDQDGIAVRACPCCGNADPEDKHSPNFISTSVGHTEECELLRRLQKG